MSTTTPVRSSARDRLLDAADELFYAEGVHSVGIDRVIERAGVAKASLYNTFGSKDELVRAYLNRRHESRRQRLTTQLERFPTAREKLVGVFEVQAETVASPGYRGCAFLNASAEAPAGGTVASVCDMSRAWMRSLFADLAAQAGVARPEHLAAQLMLLYDGASASAQLDRNPTAALDARAAAEVLIAAALPA
jgi:AcrR family transcriptional regulator